MSFENQNIEFQFELIEFLIKRVFCFEKIHEFHFN